MFEKGTRAGICHAMHRYAKASNKYMKMMTTTKKSLYLMYLDANNLYGWAMSRKLPVNGFKWKKRIQKIDKDFIKIMMKILIKHIFLNQMFSIQNILLMLMAILHFQQKEIKFKSAISLFVI